MTDQKPTNTADPGPGATSDIVTQNASTLWEFLLDSARLSGEWWTESDLQFKLLLALLLWLAVNLVLIHCAWSVYGDRLTDVFMKGRGKISPKNVTSKGFFII